MSKSTLTNTATMTKVTTNKVPRGANSPVLKRSIPDDDLSNLGPLPSPKKVEFDIEPSVQIISPIPLRSSHRTDHRRRSSLDRPGRWSTLRRPSYPPQSSLAFTPHMPSFMSVFDGEAYRRGMAEFIDGNIDSNALATSSSKPSTNNDICFGSVDPGFAVFHQPRDSTSTSASESAESSPTTTVSTLDSSSMTESSPGPSPESPAAAMSPRAFIMDSSRFRSLDRTKTEPVTSPFFDMQRRATPAKKARNLKNLAVNTSGTYPLGRAINTAPFQPPRPTDRASAPGSPSFVKPPTPPRRKLGSIGLTIMTPANSTMAQGATIPSTPSMNRPATLRHFQSSPSLPLCTPSVGPLGGMSLPEVGRIIAPRGFADIPFEDEEEDQEPNFDVPQSQEEKPDSYPNGPIRIYESGVDLYYEPSVEVASRYDVIFNVASEVKNPFVVAAEAAKSQAQLMSSPTVGIIAEPSQQSGSPTTPKATPLSATAPNGLAGDALPSKLPEYIHIPWEHNADIVPDLHRLVKVMDDRVQQGKKVLVHCQCGVSRSASLIVAYGLYKNPGITVQEAYDAVKKRSKWIGPNMNLIMQLQEFRSGLLRNVRRDHGYQSQVFTLPRKSSIVASASTESFGTRTPSAPATPRTAPLPPDRDASTETHQPGSMVPFSAGPVEPGSFSGSLWESGFRRSWGLTPSNNDLSLAGVSLMSGTPYVDPKGHIVPVVAVLQNGQSSMAPPAPVSLLKTQGETRNVEQPKSLKRKTSNLPKPLPLRRDYDELMMDAPPAPPVEGPFEAPLFSPRSEEFHMVPVQMSRQSESHDLFNILSPLGPPAGFAAAFAAPFTAPEAVPMEPPLHAQSIFSPTSGSFPSLQPLHIPSKPDQSESQYKPNQRIDSLFPQTLSAQLLAEPSPPRKLRTKFSAPNLVERKRLQKLQTEITAQLPARPAEAEEALMSPRSGEFTSNPFRDLNTANDTSVRGADRTREQAIAGVVVEGGRPVTPTPSDSDPRSPAQVGISPITRNIWGFI